MTVANILPFRIRFATSSDNVLLAQIGAQTFFDAFANANTPENMAAYLSSAFNLEKQAQELAESSSRFLIAEIENAVVGYARLKFGQAPVQVVGTKPIEIARFYSCKEWIGKGVGARLMQACFEIARQDNCDVIWLATWQRNPRANAFYRKWGFQPVGTQTFQLGKDVQDDWIMARQIGLIDE